MHTEFYDDRYKKGYMESWEREKLMKVKELILRMNLPEKGVALDFGCGNGIFTGIIKNILPKWDVYGTEISKTAIYNAQQRYPNCLFLSPDQLQEYQNKFNFIFSHHVLEHVENINETFTQLNHLSSKKCKHLHILPCGNEGSFEYKICKMIKNGIEKEKENRFFFEEPGHNRRLTSKDFQIKMESQQFKVEKEYYANQLWGAINWITKSSPKFVKKLTNQHMAIDNSYAKKLIAFRLILLPLCYAQHALVLFLSYKNRFKKNLNNQLKLMLLTIPALFSLPISLLLNKLAELEWKKAKNDKRGSEMFLIYHN